jgi:hypothetical protein
MRNNLQAHTTGSMIDATCSQVLSQNPTLKNLTQFLVTLCCQLELSIILFLFHSLIATDIGNTCYLAY